MAIGSISSPSAITQLFRGLSTDAKPTQNVEPFALFFESDTDDVYEFGGTTWKKKVAAGGLKTILADSDGNTVSSGEVGDVYSRIMLAVAATDTPDTADGKEVWYSASGCKELKLTAITKTGATLGDLASGEAITVATSTNTVEATAKSEVATILAGRVAEVKASGVLTGSDVSGVELICRDQPRIRIPWDGTNKITCIGIQSNSATTYHCNLMTVQ